MLDKIASFHENAVDFFTHFNERSLFFIKNYLTQLIALFLFLFLAFVQYNSSVYIGKERYIEKSIEETLLKEEEEVIQVIRGNSYQSPNGMIRKLRVHGSQSTFDFFFEDSFENFYVWNESENKWLKNSLDIHPLLAEAFIKADIGIVNEYSNKQAIVDGTVYDVELNNYSVKIEDIGTYSPLPTLSPYINRFIESYTENNIEHLQRIDIKRHENYETIYFESDSEVYALNAYFDDSANIGIVKEGIEKIKNP